MKHEKRAQEAIITLKIIKVLYPSEKIYFTLKYHIYLGFFSHSAPLRTQVGRAASFGLFLVVNSEA